MNPASDTAPGRQRGWNLLEKLGEGDAGEVYRVESLIDSRPAILKRPRRNSFPSDLIRQATQIENEAAILSILSGFDSPARWIHTPTLIDQSQPGAEFTERYFIVISPATGFSLGQYARLIHFPDRLEDIAGNSEAASLSKPEAAFFNKIAQLGAIPELILLRLITGLIEYLELIHNVKVELPKETIHGILWNDIKPDHIYWDAEGLRFTLIDWGNSQFLGEDGISLDRQSSRSNDFMQFWEEFDGFLENAAPDLKTRLDWQQSYSQANIYASAILPLKEKAAQLLKAATTERNRIRRSEADLVQLETPVQDDFSELLKIHQKIIALGELPEYAATQGMFIRIAQNLAQNDRLDELTAFFRHASNVPFLATETVKLLSRLADLAASGQASLAALEAALQADWASAFWELRLSALSDPPPAWWDDLSVQIRAIETGSNVIQPLTAAHRLVHTLQEQKARNGDTDPYDNLSEQLNSIVIERWKELEPNPPDAGITYQDVRRALAAAMPALSELAQPLYQALDQPEAQSRIALDAWERQDFDSTRKALRRMLLWDPDRLRLIQADRLLQDVPRWVDEVRLGLVHHEPLQDFVTRLELRGRDLRNQIASAAWLDDLLDAFKLLRKGVDPTDVLVQHTQSRLFLDWLISLEPRRPILASPGKTVQIERKDSQPEMRPILFGLKEAHLGRKSSLRLNEPLDTWVPEARGSSARLFSGSLLDHDGNRRPAALKIMRPDRREYALPLFREEAQILSLLRNTPGIVPLLECGLISLDSESNLPPEEHNISADSLTGEARRYGLDSIHNFLADLEPAVQSGLLPYLAVEKYARTDNLLLQCDTGYNNGRFLPTLEGLVMAIQICDLLQVAHSRNIIYRDHKILHYYWNEEANGIYMIDWNVARRVAGGLSTEEIQFDLVQFGARALHYILAGRSAPGALPLGPNKPEEIEGASRTYEVSWTYDDQRLPKDAKDVLAATLAGEYNDARNLKGDLVEIFQKLSSLVRTEGG